MTPLFYPAPIKLNRKANFSRMVKCQVKGEVGGPFSKIVFAIIILCETLLRHINVGLLEGQEGSFLASY